MKFKEGQIVKHKLTEEQLIIVGIFPGRLYKCKNAKYEIINCEECEIE